MNASAANFKHEEGFNQIESSIKMEPKKRTKSLIARCSQNITDMIFESSDKASLAVAQPSKQPKPCFKAK